MGTSISAFFLFLPHLGARRRPVADLKVPEDASRRVLSDATLRLDLDPLAFAVVVGLPRKTVKK